MLELVPEYAQYFIALFVVLFVKVVAIQNLEDAGLLPLIVLF